LLKAAGHGEDYLEPHYSCKLCGDTGYVDGRMCDCMKKLLRTEAYHRLNTLTPLSLSTFESFSLNYYPDTAGENGSKSPRSVMASVLNNCKNYAAGFSLSSPNLIMQGGTGLGKTHLSLAIANTAIQKGFGVVYCSVNNIITKLEREHFGRDDGDTDRMLLECDLLILDDLGTEFKSSFSSAEIYNIVNTRLMSQKPTIISTNLSIQELQDRYTERFASRIMGNYVRVTFCGRDNRLQKLMRN
jgi:DNA replication protein DnaC